MKKKLAFEDVKVIYLYHDTIFRNSFPTQAYLGNNLELKILYLFIYCANKAPLSQGTTARK